MTRSRDPNLDLLRALAIIAVLIYHIHGMWPTRYQTFAPIAHLGKYGVTLFFVLSGWLIGGIYWRERDSQAKFSVFNFWVRRWFRTVPPYLAGMTLGYLAVRFARNEPFDLRYLYFGQNYAHKIPFYLLSWSLCVEEHFYLLLPLIGAFALKMPKLFAAAFLWMLPLLPLIFRFLDPNVELESIFGYSKAATHLVAEGLALGVASAFTSRHFPVQWSATQSVAKYLAVPALILFASISFWGAEMEFWFGQTVAAFCCFVWLAATAGQHALPLATNKFVYVIAISSYSVYLTHGLVIHIGRRVASPSGGLVSEVVCLIIWLSMIAFAGGVFYYGIERTSIRLRNFVSQWLVKRSALPENSRNHPT